MMLLLLTALRDGQAGGGPVTHDRTTYPRAQRHRTRLQRLQHWRGLATRYDKHAVVYRGGLVVAALLWITDLGDTS
jgi:transposase